MNINELKKLAAEKAVEEISSGMLIGLGSGTTFQFALEKIAERIKNGELGNIVGIPSSSKTEKEAIRLGIPIITFNELFLSENGKRETENERQATEQSERVINNEKTSFNRLTSHVSPFTLIDLTIDGADEFDERLNLIKGGGGALLHEKILAQASKKLIIITDETKLSKCLGTKWPVPVEVFKFSLEAEKKFLESLDAKIETRKNPDGSNYVTDENNFILDANFGEIKNVKDLSDKLNDRAGIAGHGLFVGLTSKLYCAMSNGEIRMLNAEIRNQK